RVSDLAAACRFSKCPLGPPGKFCRPPTLVRVVGIRPAHLDAVRRVLCSGDASAEFLRIPYICCRGIIVGRAETRCVHADPVWSSRTGPRLNLSGAFVSKSEFGVP